MRPVPKGGRSTYTRPRLIAMIVPSTRSPVEGGVGIASINAFIGWLSSRWIVDNGTDVFFVSSDIYKAVRIFRIGARALRPRGLADTYFSTPNEGNIT